MSITEAAPEPADAEPICPYCQRERWQECDGKGWLPALGPYRDGSYSTSRPCPNWNPFAAD